jgi:hypothetical protein
MYVKRRLSMMAAAAVALTITMGAQAGASAPLVFHRPIVVVGANQSNNWSGYNQGTVEQGGKLFNSVSGTWTVPTARPHKAGEAEFSSAWVGIGGGCIDAGCTATDSTLIQAGTEQDVDSSGHASYSAWWELIPAPSITISEVAVKAGDKVAVSITESPANSNVWTILVRNLTNGQSFSQTVPYSSTHATAEWIVETPVVVQDDGSVTVGPLPKLTTVRIDSAKTNGANAALKSSEEMQLVDFNGKPLATPSAPDRQADGFNDCTYASTCTAPR